MPRFPKSTGFKLPGVGGRNVNTPGGFRKDQNAESVGYCSTTEESMLPAGSSPLLAKGPHHDTGWIVPPADTPSYTGSSWPTKKSEKQRVEEQPGEEPKPPVEAKINTPEYTPPKFEGDLTVPDLTGKGKPVEQDRIEIEIGDGNYQGGGTFENPEQKTWYNNQISQRTNKGMSHEEAIQDYRNTFKIGKQDKDIAVIEGVKGKFRRTK